MTEFYPPDPRLLGLNVNRGQKVCIRLRHPHRQSEFLPYEHILGESWDGCMCVCVRICFIAAAAVILVTVLVAVVVAQSIRKVNINLHSSKLILK